MPNDRYGLSLTTSPPAAAVYVDAVDRLLAAREGALEGFDRALAADPGFALAHVGLPGGLVVPGRARLRAHRGPRLEGGGAADRALARARGAQRPRRARVGPRALRAGGRRERSSVRRGLDPRLSAGGGFALSPLLAPGPLRAGPRPPGRRARDLRVEHRARPLDVLPVLDGGGLGVAALAERARGRPPR